jgi:hypothetical protein
VAVNYSHCMHGWTWDRQAGLGALIPDQLCKAHPPPTHATPCVAAGLSTEELLATYDQERRPVAWANTRLSMANWEAAVRVPSALGLNPRAASIMQQVVSAGGLWAVLQGRNIGGVSMIFWISSCCVCYIGLCVLHWAVLCMRDVLHCKHRKITHQHSLR